MELGISEINQSNQSIGNVSILTSAALDAILTLTGEMPVKSTLFTLL